MTKVKRTARKYIKATKRRDLSEAVNYLKQLGYEVVFYNTPVGNELIKAYGLEWEIETKKAFTCYQEKAIKAVFVDDYLHSSDKLYLLLHEIGHILLKHIGELQDEYCDTILADVEADAFAYEVMNYKNKKSILLPAVLGAVVSLGAGFAVNNITEQTQAVPAYENIPDATNYSNSTNVSYDIPVSATKKENAVYVTRTGSKYHLKNCRYVKNKADITELSIKEAQLSHTPCSVCNP